MYDDSFRKRYGIAPVAISCNTNAAPTHPHIHNEIEMLYIAEGNSSIKISERCYSARAGDLFFVNPLEVHSVTVEREPYCHRCICFDCSLIADKKLEQALLDGAKRIPGRTDSEKLIRLFEGLYHAVESSNAALLFDATAFVSLIFSEFINRQMLIENSSKDKATAFSKEVIDYISKHYDENLTSKQIAEDLFYNQSYFCRVFRKNFGVSFSAYLTMYRILIAKDKLKNTSGRIADIASECGFENTSYFTRCFKNCMGITPLKYQKSQ